MTTSKIFSLASSVFSKQKSVVKYVKSQIHSTHFDEHFICFSHLPRVWIEQQIKWTNYLYAHQVCIPTGETGGNKKNKNCRMLVISSRKKMHRREKTGKTREGAVDLQHLITCPEKSFFDKMTLKKLRSELGGQLRAEKSRRNPKWRGL